MQKSCRCGFMYGELTDKETISRIEECLEAQIPDQFEILLYKKNSELSSSYFFLHVRDENKFHSQRGSWCHVLCIFFFFFLHPLQNKEYKLRYLFYFFCLFNSYIYFLYCFFFFIIIIIIIINYCMIFIWKKLIN